MTAHPDIRSTHHDPPVSKEQREQNERLAEQQNTLLRERDEWNGSRRKVMHTTRTKCYTTSKVKKSCKWCDDKRQCEVEMNAVHDSMGIKYRWHPQDETQSEKKARIDAELVAEGAVF